jgi:hypothetical protein
LRLGLEKPARWPTSPTWLSCRDLFRSANLDTVRAILPEFAPMHPASAADHIGMHTVLYAHKARALYSNCPRSQARVIGGQAGLRSAPPVLPCAPQVDPAQPRRRR